MIAILKSLRAGAAALTLLVTAGVAQAELSATEQAAIDGKSGLRVFTSDGAYVGITNGLYFFQGDRIRMFVVSKSGSLFRRKADEVNVTTFTDRVSLTEGNLILDATKLDMRNAAPPQLFRFDGPLDIALLSRR